MLDLNELEQLISFSELGTLAKVAEKFHISTPTITRAMQNLETEFGAMLFTRTRNSITLNDTGLLALTYSP